MNIEVTFNNGKIVEFPCVKENTIKVDSNKNWYLTMERMVLQQLL